MAENTKAQTKPGFWTPENLRQLAILVLAIVAFRWSVASPYHVPTASMEPTIKVGDRLLAFKLSYALKLPFTDISLLSWGTPKRGDIIVFKYPQNPDIDYVKRVVGVPGDHIKVEDNVLYINGKAQSRESSNNDRSILEDITNSPDQKDLYRENLEGLDHWVMQDKISSPYFDMSRKFPADGEDKVVPEASFFVMGDNRDNSTDSRSWGFVPNSYIRGKALFVLWSWYSPDGGGFWPSVRFDRFGHWLK
jgi:signal peptidase I